MAVISVSITASSEEIVSGIPRSVTLDTNIPSTIFYTLDGTEPTVSSDIYVEAIKLPTDKPIVLLKIMATDGVDYSSIIEEEYFSNMLDNTRLPHSPTDAQSEQASLSSYPFGSNYPQPNTHYLNPSEAGVTVDNPLETEIPNGYDGSGNETSFSNEDYTTENYSIVYTKTDAQGRTGPFIGTMPATVTVERPEPAPSESTMYSTTFDPRAFVIFQDVSKEDPSEPPQINRQFFSLQDHTTQRDGALLFNTGLDAPPISGSFLRAHFNPRDNTMTYYYFDSSINKWVISKIPYQITNIAPQSFAGVLSSRRPGSKYVYEWIPFARRVLF